MPVPLLQPQAASRVTLAICVPGLLAAQAILRVMVMVLALLVVARLAERQMAAMAALVERLHAVVVPSLLLQSRAAPSMASAISVPMPAAGQAKAADLLLQLAMPARESILPGSLECPRRMGSPGSNWVNGVITNG